MVKLKEASLRTYRKTLGIPQEDIENGTGISQTRLSLIENGYVTFEHGEAEKIQAYFEKRLKGSFLMVCGRLPDYLANESDENIAEYLRDAVDPANKANSEWSDSIK